MTTSPGPTLPGMQSAFANLNTVQNLGSGYTPALETSVNTSVSSAPDVTATINGLMQQLVGRFATAAELKQYGSELLAAQKANPSTSTATMTWDPKTGKMLSKQSTGTSTGVNAADFLSNLISGSAGAHDYAKGVTYFNAINQFINQNRGG